MKQLNRMLILTAAATMLTACVNTRDPRPVEMAKHSDRVARCHQLEAEYRANTEAAGYKISKNTADDGRDVLLGLFVWPGLADFKNADGIEGNALLDRNAQIRQIGIQRRCNVHNWPVQPTRYD